MLVNLESVLSKYVNTIDHPIVAVETGCSFMWDDDNVQYLSTPGIIKNLVAPTDGILYSLDINEERINICRKELDKLGLSKYVKFLLGDSVESIKKIAEKINFVWLDSSESAEHAISEYNALLPLLSKRHIVCVDDYDCPNSVKWQDVSRIIKNTFSSYATFKTPTGLILGINTER